MTGGRANDPADAGIRLVRRRQPQCMMNRAARTLVNPPMVSRVSGQESQA
jgi:hypothetical protein